MEKSPNSNAARLRMSFAACALVVAATATEPAAQAAGSMFAATIAASRTVQAAVVEKISAYCQRSWQNAGIEQDAWDDCTQDVFARILKSLGQKRLEEAITDQESDSRRELNRAIWATTQRWRRAARPSSLNNSDFEETRVDPWVEVSARLSLVREAIHSEDAGLTETQRDIITRWSNGQSIAAIASDLDSTPARVSDDKYKAVQKLKRCLVDRNAEPSAESRA